MADENTSITLDSLVSRTQEILSSEMGQETVMLDAAKGTYFGMDAAGSAIWRMLEAPIRVADLCAKLQAQFIVSAEDCRRDVLEFLDQLREHGLLNVQSAG